MRILRQPLRLSDQQFIDHLPHFFRCADGPDQRIVQHSLLQQIHVARDRRLNAHPLYTDADIAGGGASQGQGYPFHHVDAEPVHKSWAFDDAIGRQVGNGAAVLHIEVAAIGPAGFQRFQNMARMFIGALIVGQGFAGLVRNTGKSVSNQFRFSVV